MTVSKETLDEIALTPQEYEAIVQRLDREPNHVELGMFGALWSEHCGYKHSKQLLRQFPSESPHLLVVPGQENAGVIDIGDGLAAVFKIESHNHPTAVEPYQGAATGVGGIVRDILAMGARPIALLNSLRFGSLTQAKESYLFNGAVSGIAGYGNCIGVPDVGGEIFFSPTYATNPLVNALCLGIVPTDGMVRAVARTPGNLLVLVGAETGRDGIHGASGLASRTFETDQERRPAVQVGNPFLEKVLIEACLEVAQAGLLEGMQDLGAAGLTSSTVESAAKGGTGFELDVSLVPRREEGMTPYEVMLSESQERMLLIVPPQNLSKIQAIFEKWDTLCNVIGKVTSDGMARIVDGNTHVGMAPVLILTHPPLYTVEGNKPTHLEELQTYDLASLALPQQTAAEVLLKLLGSPNIASKEWVYRQYDHQVQTNTVIGPGGDAAVLRIKASKRGLAMSTDGNGRYCYLDPYVGGMIAVAEACRNVSVVGAEPIALTDCLNFGNPERPEGYYQLEQCIMGIALASRLLEAPVISGNVSLYNETRGEAIYPTPVIGALGLLDDVTRNASIGFADKGDVVLLIGATESGPESLAGSEYLEVMHGLVAGQPRIDMELELVVQRACRRAVAAGLVSSAHDCSDGGLAVAVAESCIAGGIGFVGSLAGNGRWDAALFGEEQSRIVMSVSPSHREVVEAMCAEEGAPVAFLGEVGGEALVFERLLDVPIEQMAEAWNGGLERAAEGPAAAG